MRSMEPTALQRQLRTRGGLLALAPHLASYVRVWRCAVRDGNQSNVAMLRVGHAFGRDVDDLLVFVPVWQWSDGGHWLATAGLVTAQLGRARDAGAALSNVMSVHFFCIAACVTHRSTPIWHLRSKPRMMRQSSNAVGHVSNCSTIGEAAAAT